ncbi:hypothetical protein BGZ67_006101, partial [Mortierella alpina]
QHYQGMINQPEQGTITPVSPLMHPSNSGFFENSGSSAQQQYQQLAAYGHHHHTHHQQQAHQLPTLSQLQQQHQHAQQQMHNAAMHAHHMNMSLGISEMTLANSHFSNGLASSSNAAGVLGLSQLGASGHHALHGSLTALSSACSTPTTMVKMDLPVLQAFDENSLNGAFLPTMSQLSQQSHYQQQHPRSHHLDSAVSNLGPSTELEDSVHAIHQHQHHQHLHSQYEQEQLDTLTAASSGVDVDHGSTNQYSPLMEQGYHASQQQQMLYQQQQQQQQQAFQDADYSSQTYSTNDHQFQSTYTAAISLTALPLMQQPQQHQQHSLYEPQQQGRLGYSRSPAVQQQQQHPESSPGLTQNQAFQKQIQQEQQRFHDQQQQQLLVAASTTSVPIPLPTTVSPTMTSLTSISTSNLTAQISSSTSSATTTTATGSDSVSGVTSPTSSSRSGAPSLSCSIPTPGTAMSTISTPPQSASFSCNNTNNSHALSMSLLDHEPKNHLSSLLTGAHDL